MTKFILLDIEYGDCEVAYKEFLVNSDEIKTITSNVKYGRRTAVYFKGEDDPVYCLQDMDFFARILL
jgi:hypothetical protein